MEMEDLQRRVLSGLCREVSACRMCDSADLVEYLDLGHTPPADQFRTKEELTLPEIHYPLRVLLCQSCGLSQLSHVVDPRVLYQFDYPYESSTTATGKAHWDMFAKEVSQRLRLPAGSLVVDVGSNVGTLLESFRDCGMDVIGVDPAPNITAIANAAGVKTYTDFFGMVVAKEIKDVHGTAHAIVGTNVFAHIDNLAQVLEAAKELMHEDGAFIFESPYMGNLVEHLEYDTIYHEHLSYLSLSPVVQFAKRFGLEVFAVEEQAIHGGSFRVYIGREGKRPTDSSVTDILAREKLSGIHDIGTLRNFAMRVEKNREALTALVSSLRAEGKTIAVVSTPAKGMTLLNYCGLTNVVLSFATEKSKLKIGRYTPGGHIPIFADTELLSRNPDYALLLAWNFAPEIIRNNEAYTKKGGKFIIPIPTPHIA